MKKQIAIALQRHEEQKARAKNRYKPILFIVTMSIAEGERAKKMLEERLEERKREEIDKINSDDTLTLIQKRKEIEKIKKRYSFVAPFALSKSASGLQDASFA